MQSASALVVLPVIPLTSEGRRRPPRADVQVAPLPLGDPTPPPPPVLPGLWWPMYRVAASQAAIQPLAPSQTRCMPGIDTMPAPLGRDAANSSPRPGPSAVPPLCRRPQTPRPDRPVDGATRGVDLLCGVRGPTACRAVHLMAVAAASQGGGSRVHVSGGVLARAPNPHSLPRSTSAPAGVVCRALGRPRLCWRDRRDVDAVGGGG